ncbi:MAG: hypothetical protein EBX50_15605 [Chitinophagia bacterium]|nr:hypothetical protein [Chitinophagia bacterium]
MAKRKKHHRRTSRRRRMGAVTTGGLQTALSITAGAVLGRILSKKLEGKMNPTMTNGIQIAAGLVLPKFAKNKMVAGLATGMFVNGTVGLLQSTGVIGAIGAIGETDEDTLQISGSSDINEIAGIGEYEESDESFAGIQDDGVMSGGSSDIAILAGDDWESDVY